MSRNPQSDRRLSAQPLRDRHDDPRQENQTRQGVPTERRRPSTGRPPQGQRPDADRQPGRGRQSSRSQQYRRPQQSQQSQQPQQRQQSRQQPQRSQRPQQSQRSQRPQPQQPGRTQQARQAAGTGIRAVEEGDRYVHVQYRDPDAFDVIRTPDWAARAAGDVAPGAEVRTGKLTGSDEWHTESVLIPKPVDAATAMELANRIVAKIGE